MRYFIPLLLTVSCTTTDPTPTAEPIPKLGTKAPTAEQRAESLAIFTAVMGGLIKGLAEESETEESYECKCNP